MQRCTKNPLRRICKQFVQLVETQPEEHELLERENSFYFASHISRALSFASNLRLVVTKYDKIGLAPFFAEPGDLCFCFLEYPTQ
jgi:hypothetical protein